MTRARSCIVALLASASALGGCASVPARPDEREATPRWQRIARYESRTGRLVR